MGTPPDRAPGHPEPPKDSSLGVSTQESTKITPPGAIADVPTVGAAWGHLRLLEELGRGSFGRVFRAWDGTLAREVALKILRLESVDDAALSAVLREGQMLARIRHPHVVTVHGAQQIGREVGVWMELVRGRTLSQMVREDGPLGPEEAAIVGMTLCDALAAVHSAGLVHRDIKAQNVMRESGGRIVLMDFGAGVELIQRRRHPELVGTPLYMSPAVLAGAAWSPAADLYSVGVLLFYLVTSRFPVEGNSMGEIATAHALGEQRTLADVRPGLPDGFSRVVRRALASRYRSAGEMMRDLAEAIPGREVTSNAVYSPAEVSPRTPNPAQTPGTAAPMTQSGAITPLQIGYAMGGIAGVWALGILTSAAFNHSLRRDPSFYDGNETLLRDFAWGVSALFPPAVYMLLALIAARGFGVVWRAAVRFIPPFTRVVLAVRRRWHRGTAGVVAGGNGRVAQWLVAGQVVALGVTIAAFWPFVSAFGSLLDTAPPETFALLDVKNGIHLFYRLTLSILALAMVLGWRALLRHADAADPVDAVTTFAGLGAIVITLVLIVAPFRLVHHSYLERVFLDTNACFVLGEKGRALQLFCPTMPQRVRVVSDDDPQLERRGERDYVFSDAAARARSSPN